MAMTPGMWWRDSSCAVTAEVPRAPVSASSGRPDKRSVQRAFHAAAERYDHLAELQRRVAERLFENLATVRPRCSCWLDVGTGTGYCAAHLSRLFPGSRALALDLAEGMLHQLRRAAKPGPALWLVAGDAEALPLTDRSVDLIVSSLALQWCPEPGRAFAELARVLQPGGYLCFATFGSGTLIELRKAWAEADGFTHVNHFNTADELAAGLAGCGLATIALESEARAVRYDDVTALMRELKGLGAHNVTAGRPRGLLGKNALARMIAAYRSGCSTADGGIEASFEVIYGVARRNA